ncbi:hypothetical protein [Aeromonas caviae]|uniref:hypothetical protein n=2 Tax=Aeromonadaceae TaxID=84642 RepID=UPI0005ED66A0|nr:hypothetical protein [Aeromonas caviae]ATP90397.1 hypothetical protein VI35_09025 [Aeromonas caviae]
MLIFTQGEFMIILKIVVALVMLALIAVGTFQGGWLGFVITVGMTLILNGMFNRWDAKRQNPSR